MCVRLCSGGTTATTTSLTDGEDGDELLEEDHTYQVSSERHRPRRTAMWMAGEGSVDSLTRAARRNLHSMRLRPSEHVLRRLSWLRQQEQLDNCCSLLRDYL